MSSSGSGGILACECHSTASSNSKHHRTWLSKYIPMLITVTSPIFSRTRLKLHTLDDAHLQDGTDVLTDRHGCPAYISPEMLQPGSYSGQAADLWSLGIILYTLLVGHYPFFDTNPQNLFSKIRSGYYPMPENISSLAKSVISSLLAYDPSQRVPAAAIIEHPWFRKATDDPPYSPPLADQTVPRFIKKAKLC